ncbi:MAG: helix-turn-helix domain-containing protein [Actinomycetota bacterium]
MRTQPPLLLPLFRSGNQARVLSFLYFSREPSTAQEVSTQLSIPYPTVHREIGRLLQAGILIEKKNGNYRFFSPNKESPYYRSLKELLELSTGPVPLLKAELEKVSGVTLAAIFGSWARRTLGEQGKVPADIDLLIVGQPDVRKIYDLSRRVSRALGIEVNPIILSKREWLAKTPFNQQIRKEGVIEIIGSQKKVAAS